MTLTINNIPIEVVFKNIKNINLRISRSTGKVNVTAPRFISQSKIHQFINSKADWITKHHTQNIQNPKKQNIGITLEEVIINCNVFEVNIIPTKSLSEVSIVNDHVSIFTKKPDDNDYNQKLLQTHFKSILINKIQNYIRCYEPIMKVKSTSIVIRKMTSRWGSCNIRSGKLCFNLNLICRSDKFLEMVVIHELTHLLEKSHNKRFYDYMTQFMPDWREYK